MVIYLVPKLNITLHLKGKYDFGYIIKLINYNTKITWCKIGSSQVRKQYVGLC